MNHSCTPLAEYIRIYEKDHLDSFCPKNASGFAQSSLAFLRLEGSHVN